MNDSPLTARETQMLQLVADGLAPCQIAQRLNVSQSTVRHHLAATIRKTGHASTLQAVLTGVRRGWIHAPALTPTDKVIWLERFERHLIAAEKQLRTIANDRRALSLDARDYLTALDEHLALRHWDELGLVQTRVRMRALIEKVLTPQVADG